MFSNFLAPYKKITKVVNSNYQIGFGLVELMVSITIVTIVSGIILTKQSSFNSAVLLRSQAYEIALRAREIQLSAVSASNDSGVSQFRSVLGLYFDTVTYDGTYKVFRDNNIPNNYWYDDVNEEFDVQGLLDRRFMIDEIRAVDSLGSTPVNAISVVYERPNFDARFFDGSGSEISEPVVQIDVKLRNAVGDVCGRDVRTVEFTSTGQISVNECP